MGNRADLQVVALSLALLASAWSLEPGAAVQQRTARSSFTVDQILSLPTPDNLIA